MAKTQLFPQGTHAALIDAAWWCPGGLTKMLSRCYQLILLVVKRPDGVALNVMHRWFPRNGIGFLLKDLPHPNRCLCKSECIQFGKHSIWYVRLITQLTETWRMRFKRSVLSSLQGQFNIHLDTQATIRLREGCFYYETNQNNTIQFNTVGYSLIHYGLLNGDNCSIVNYKSISAKL